MQEGAYYFNAEETQRISSQPIYIQYRKWLQDNGVITDPALIYPAYFGPKRKGVIGVATSKPLPANYTFIAVPYDLIITVDKVKEDPSLLKIIEENPNLFKIHHESAFGILALYLCIEMMKKEESFYFPYFAVADDIKLTNWTHWDILAIENLDVAAHIRKQKDDMEKNFMTFLAVFRRYPDVFPQDISNGQYMKVFERAYNFICTRAFGWSLPSISLIPMADSLNHNNDYVTHMLVDTALEVNPHEKYSPKHKRVNLSLLSQFCKEIPQAPIPPRKQSRVQLFINKHRQILQNSSPKDPQAYILSQQYKAEVRNLRQLHFYESSCEEDNDTDEDTIEKFQFDLEKFRFYEKYETVGINEKNKAAELSRYWKIYLDEAFDQYLEETEVDPMESPQKRDSKLIKEEFKKEGKESEGSSLVASSSSEDSDDEEFKWMAANPDSHRHSSTFFIMATRKPAKKNEELFNFYGRRSNRFLLVGYNFVLDQNKYDSFAFRICVDDWNNPKAFLTKQPASKLIYRQKDSRKKTINYFTKEIRVKKHRICIQLINHCRALLIGWSQLPANTRVLVMIPFSLQFEKNVLALAADFVSTFRKEYMTSIEEDEELIENCQKQESKAAIKLRLCYKNILDSQLQIIGKCQQWLKVWKNGRLNATAESDIPWIRKTRQYLCSLERGRL